MANRSKSWWWIVGPQVNVKMPGDDIDKTVATVAKVSHNKPGDLKVYTQTYETMKWIRCWHTAEVTK